ncbi:hypothetical protein [Candidatus Villigracilis proximus]|uniref:hypothetical protein n=1 Tax=Candidatus Villigracilis proximus TaxID=3140683 RepID=UPI0031ED0EED
MKPFDILVAGEINPDLILSGNVTPEFGQVEKLVDSATLAIGSSSVIFACGVARLGLKVAFIGKCGDDVFRALHAGCNAKTRRGYWECHRLSNRIDGLERDSESALRLLSGRPRDSDSPRLDR